MATNNPNSTGAQAPRRRRNTTRDLFLWLNEIKADRELSPTAFLVAFEIGQHFNARYGGAAWPSSLTIANNIGIDKATVIRVVRQLRERGHLIVEPGRPGGPPGRGHSNRYRMPKSEIKGASVHPSEPRKGALVSRKGAPAHLNYLQPSTVDAKASTLERVVALRATVPPGALAPYGGAPEGIAEVFAELRGIWARPWLDDEAADHAAFLKVISAGVDPADVLDGARTWVAAVEARFRKPLAKWLAARGWEKPPPPRRQRRGTKPSLAAMFIKAGQS